MFTDLQAFCLPQFSIPVKLPNRQLIYKDLSYLYNPTKSPINPLFNVTDQTDESSVLSVRFSTSDLFFSEANPQGVPTAMLLVTVKLYSMTQGKSMVDTSALYLKYYKGKRQAGICL
jgi:hypothetical protein